MKIEDINLFKKMNDAKQNNNKKTYQEIRNTIMLNNLGLVRSRVQRICGYQDEDLLEAGNEALIRAIETYDIEKGTEFSTYAVILIDQDITVEFKSKTTQISIPHDKYLKVKKAMKNIAKQNKETTPQEISMMTGIEAKEVDKILEILRSPMSLNYSPEDSDSDLYELINPNPEKTDEQVESNLIKQEILSILDKRLKPSEKNIIMLRYYTNNGKNRSLEEVGKMLHITRERVRQIEQRALRKLKKITALQELDDYEVKNENKVLK